MSVLQNPGRYNNVSFSTQTRHNYTVNSYFPSRKPRPSSVRGQGHVRRDLNDTMQHATLINIVAAVNEDLGNGQRDFKRTSVPYHDHSSYHHRSNMTIISNLVFPHDKSISIPQTKQREFNLPEKVVQRKPVYYKHTKDLEVHNHANQIRLFEDGDSYNFKVNLNKQMEKEKEHVSRESKSKHSSSMDTKHENVKKAKSTDDKNNKASRDSDVRVSSGVRRLGTLKKSEPRQLHELHKCDAIDLLDNDTDIDDPAMSALDDSRKLIPTNHMARIPYIRTKSLPAMLQTKSAAKTSWSMPSAGHKQSLILTDRPLSKSLRQRTPDSMYKRISNLPGGFGFGDVSINNGTNEAPDLAVPLVHDTSKVRNIASMVTDRQKRSRNAKSPSSSMFGRESQTTMTTSDNEEDLYHNRRLASQSNLYKSKRALHEAVKRVLTGRTLVCETSISRKLQIEERREPQSIKVKKSFQQSRPTTGKSTSDKTATRRVQFQNDELSSESSDRGSPGQENKSPEIQGGSNILHRRTSSVRSFSPGIQPMSTKELLRLEQKILPINDQSPTPPLTEKTVFFSTASSITLQKSDSDISMKSQNSNSHSGTADSIKVDTSEEVPNEEYNDHESLTSDNVDGGEDVGNGTDSEYEEAYYDKTGNTNCSDYYKLVKAVETNPYNGYEHKKLRRLTALTSRSKDSETSHTTKAQYIKVKLS